MIVISLHLQPLLNFQKQNILSSLVRNLEQFGQICWGANYFIDGEIDLQLSDSKIAPTDKD